MTKDPVKQKEAQQKHYRANREKEIQKARERACKNRVKLREIVTEAKRKPCTDCGGEWPPYVMDLHHLRDKDDAVSSLIARNVSAKRLLEEIAKCVILCSNCHRIRTHSTEWSNRQDTSL